MPRSVEPFRFRQFSVAHDRSSMRVNTDAVLLGAWCPVPDGCEHILDVGTGSGVIALMLAQRCEAAHITAIDIDGPSVLQAEDNFRHSPWPDRLSAEQISLQEFATPPPLKGGRGDLFDLIVSNPPYFRNALPNPDPTRRQARHTDTLSFDELCACAAQLLREDGLLALVLPADAERDILASAARHGLYPACLTRVLTRPDSAPKRILLALKYQLSIINYQLSTVQRLQPIVRGFSRDKNCQLSTLLLGSEAYSTLCREFYL